jgi:hypothetical protein
MMVFADTLCGLLRDSLSMYTRTQRVTRFRFIDKIDISIGHSEILI